LLYRKGKTPVKKHILPSLRINVTTIKIKAETTTEITTKMTETLAIIKHIDNQILTANLRDVAMSTKKRIVIHGDI
jgi:hypothetical protein